MFRPASRWLVVRRRSSIPRGIAASPQPSELVVCGGRLLIVLRSSRPTASPKRTSSQPSNISFKRTAAPPLNSSVRLQELFRVGGKSTPASRPRFVSASFLRCASGRPACAARGRFVGFRNVRACVRSRTYFVLGGRGTSQRHHLVSGSSVVRSPSPFRVLAVRLVWHYRPSKVGPRVPPNSSIKRTG